MHLFKFCVVWFCPNDNQSYDPKIWLMLTIVIGETILKPHDLCQTNRPLINYCSGFWHGLVLRLYKLNISNWWDKSPTKVLMLHDPQLVTKNSQTQTLPTRKKGDVRIKGCLTHPPHQTTLCPSFHTMGQRVPILFFTFPVAPSFCVEKSQWLSGWH